MVMYDNVFKQRKIKFEPRIKLNHNKYSHVCKLFLFINSGSGSLAAMSVFESRYKPDMEVNISVCTCGHVNA